jgi:hypothetical protein
MIPHAPGLEKELSRRVTGLRFSEPRVETVEMPDHEARLHTVTRLDVHAGEETLGTLETDIYEWDGNLRIARIQYDGRVPGYTSTSSGTDRVTLLATEMIVMRRPPSGPIGMSWPNNTHNNPLYRHDSHPLEFAAYEMAGRWRNPEKRLDPEDSEREGRSWQR